jgi:hypothetical protein
MPFITETNRIHWVLIENLVPIWQPSIGSPFHLRFNTAKVLRTLLFCRQRAWHPKSRPRPADVSSRAPPPPHDTKPNPRLMRQQQRSKVCSRSHLSSCCSRACCTACTSKAASCSWKASSRVALRDASSASASAATRALRSVAISLQRQTDRHASQLSPQGAVRTRDQQPGPPPSTPVAMPPHSKPDLASPGAFRSRPQGSKEHPIVSKNCAPAERNKPHRGASWTGPRIPITDHCEIVNYR